MAIAEMKAKAAESSAGALAVGSGAPAAAHALPKREAVSASGIAQRALAHSALGGRRMRRFDSATFALDQMARKQQQQ